MPWSYADYPMAENINFIIRVPASTCVISPVNVMVLDEIDGARLAETNWKTIALKDIEINLHSCVYYAGSSGTPKIKITAAAGTYAMSNTNNLLYRNTGSTATGFGIAVFNTVSPAVDTSSTSQMVKSGDIIWQGSLNEKFASRKVYISTGVSCGPRANCSPDKLSSGALNAKFTLDFLYD